MGDGENGGIPSNPTRGPYFPNELSFPYELSRLALGVYFLVGRGRAFFCNELSADSVHVLNLARSVKVHFLVPLAKGTFC
jgi:hypothetical protein